MVRPIRSSNPNPFDDQARNYDEVFSYHESYRSIRRRIWLEVDKLVPRKGIVIDLGCGTGEDAGFFLERGNHVVAVDSSGAMLERTRAKLAGSGNRLVLVQEDIEKLQPGSLPLPKCEEPVVALFSNFGALNCVSSLANVRNLTTRVSDDGHLFFCIINRYCFRELVRGNFRRLRRQGSLTRVGGCSLPVFYPPPRDFGWKSFRRTRLLGLGVLNSSHTTRIPVVNRLGDHYFIVLRRSPERHRTG